MQNSSMIPIENFDGPYDLLLELVRTQRLDISRVSLGLITDQFLEHIESHTISPEQQADFLLVASTLLLIKIRSLLPDENQQEEEEITALTERVAMYQLYRKQAEYFDSRWGAIKLMPAHFWGPAQSRQTSAEPFPMISKDDIRDIFAQVLQHLPKPAQPTRHLVTRGRSLEQCLTLFMQRLKKAQSFSFQQAITYNHPQDIATSFLAVLELARKQMITLSQDNQFDVIMIHKAHD